MAINLLQLAISILVNEPKPITRFVLGLLDEINGFGYEEFLAHLKNFVSQLDPNNKMANTKLKK
jgi:hypothetical protein